MRSPSLPLSQTYDGPNFIKAAVFDRTTAVRSFVGTSGAFQVLLPGQNPYPGQVDPDGNLYNATDFSQFPPPETEEERYFDEWWVVVLFAFLVTVLLFWVALRCTRRSKVRAFHCFFFFAGVCWSLAFLSFFVEQESPVDQEEGIDANVERVRSLLERRGYIKLWYEEKGALERQRAWEALDPHERATVMKQRWLQDSLEQLERRMMDCQPLLQPQGEQEDAEDGRQGGSPEGDAILSMFIFGILASNYRYTLESKH